MSNLLLSWRINQPWLPSPGFCLWISLCSVNQGAELDSSVLLLTLSRKAERSWNCYFSKESGPHAVGVGGKKYWPIRGSQSKSLWNQLSVQAKSCLLNEGIEGYLGFIALEFCFCCCVVALFISDSLENPKWCLCSDIDKHDINQPQITYRQLDTDITGLDKSRQYNVTKERECIF